MKAGTLTGASFVLIGGRHRLAKVKSKTKIVFVFPWAAKVWQSSNSGLLNRDSSPVSSCEAGNPQKTAS